MLGFEKVAVNIPSRVKIAIGIVFSIFFVLILRLWYLQVVKGDYFRNQSENNRIRRVYIPPPRGYIFDRHGNILVKNRPAFNVELVKEDSPDPKETLKDLAALLGLPAEELITRLGVQKSRRRFQPRLILKDVDREVVAKVAANRHRLPGIIISVNPARDYIYGGSAAHVLGYIREVTKDQLDRSQYAGYRQGDLVGQYGVEMQWERYLQGVRGVQGVIVNASGTRIGESSFVPEQSGSSVTLTIDRDMQIAADLALKDKKGAVVAMNANTGEVLAMASTPGFNPNMFTGEVSAADWQDLVAGKEKRMNNRAAQGGYPPGSVFKAIMSVAALEEGIAGKFETVTCPGFLRFGSRRFRCHKRSGHGPVDLRKALTVSCDVYFYVMGQRLGIDRIHDYATRFGLGKPTGLQLVQEHEGIVPSTEWKRKYFRKKEDQRWYPGETLSVAIGQGALVVTPLQMTRAVAAVVNGGKVLEPYLVKEIRSADKSLIDDDFRSKVLWEVGAKPKNLEYVKQAMIDVVNSPRGTGKRARVDESLGVLVGGKTGTSQVISESKRRAGDDFDDHAWFSGFAPAEKPEIVVTALVENGGHGGVAAAPIVRQVMEAYFKQPREVIKDTKESEAA